MVNTRNKKTRHEYYLLEKFYVLNIAEKQYLIRKQKNRNNEEIKYIVVYEEFYERVNDYHIRTGHGGNVKMRMAVANKYNIPRPAIEIFLSTCAICNCKKNMNRKLVIKPIISKNFNERGQVDLVDFQSLPDGKFKWILNYQDHRTKFLSLRPLESKRASESDNGREFVNSIIIELKELWPDCVHGRPRHPQSQGSIERSNQDIENMLRAWMKDNKTKKWSIGLQFVQFQKNSSHHRVIECCMEPDSVEAILCNLCENNIKIKEARHLGAIGIEKQAEKMLQDSKIKISTFKVGDCVVIPIPKVDRGPPYPANIIGVVIDQKNYHIGTEHGILKGGFTRLHEAIVPGSEYEVKIDKLIPFTMYEITVVAVNKHGSSLPSTAIRSLTLNSDQKTSRRANTDNSTLPPLPDIRSCCMKKGITHSACLDKLCDPSRSDVAEVTDLMICAPWASQTFSCLTNGIDHTPCCRARGLPPLCQNLCAGNLTQIDFSYFKCLRFMDDYTSCLLQGYGIVASAPRRLRVSNVDVNFALFHWEPPKDLADTVTHYNVFYRLVDDEYDSITNVHSPFILEHLNANTLYEVYVEAVNGHGAGEPSQRVVFSTKSQIANDRELTTSPYNLTDCCVNIKLRQMCMPLCSFDANMTDVRSLAPFCGAELHKLIKCGAGGRNHGACCTRRGVPGICTPLCSGVVPDSLLSVAVNCASFIGNVVQCFEEGTGKLPGPVGDMHAVKLTNSSVSLVWNPPNDNNNVTSFVVHYQKVNNSTVHENTIKLDQQMEVTENSVVLMKLETGKLYKVFVVSKNIHGTSLPSSILLLNITETDLNGKGVVGVTSPPHSLSVSAHSANYVTITWQPPEFSHVSEEITYKLYWKSVAETVFHQIDVAVPAYTVENLSPNSQYIIYIVAMSKNGKSLPSETLIAWTDPAYPAFVEPPTVHPINLVMEGSSMTVLCIAMGTPSPTISLYISGRLVRQETSRHMVTVIHNVTRDMDEISCYADNGYGTPMQSSRKISISYVPKLVASKITMANLGDTVTLECMVDAHPEPKTMFWRDPQGRTPVIQSGKHNVNVIRSKEDYTKFVMELTISKLTETDDGDYFCHAENSFGSSTKPVSVRIRNSVTTNNVTQCCVQQNVTAGCLDACSSSYLDINVAIGRADCFNDFDKLMKCASDGSDHRACCSDRGVPRRCLEWCRGEPVNNKMCVLSYSKSILACFHELRDKLPGPPTNVRLENVDTHTITVKWDPPAKNPQTVEVYRVFWRRVGNNSPPEKNDTKETSMKISGLKDDLTYELVLKAGNSRGMSTLTEPIRFSTAEKDVTSAASMGESRADIGTIFGVFVAILIVGGIVAGVVYYMHGHGNLLHKSSSGVSFENPSYLREVNMENMNHTDLPYSGPTNGLNTAEWKQDHLHTATEVPPTLYEELKLGSDGAGFKRLKP
eukprot:XP_016660486.1 PREDICTED: Ig-like and fibronectin type-III domain-containing protein 2 [Acyrthosiphon pisum]